MDAFDPRNPNLAQNIDEYFDRMRDSAPDERDRMQGEAEPFEIIGDAEAQERHERERQERLRGAEEHNRMRREGAGESEEDSRFYRVDRSGLSSGGDSGMTEYERQSLHLLESIITRLDSIGLA